MTMEAQAARSTSLAFGMPRFCWTILSFVSLIGFWQLIAWWLDSIYFPGVPEVWEVLVQAAASGDLLYHVLVTLGRVIMAFVLAMCIGAAIGIALGRFQTADLFFDPWVVFFLNLPALIVIIMCYLWFGQTELAVVIAVAINKIPNVAVTLREGARRLSRDLGEMAQVYNFSWWKNLRHVVLPQLAPFFATAARTGLALVWKIVLVVEAIGGLQEGVGAQIYIAYSQLEVPVILAYAIAFIVVVQLIEMLILQPIDAHVNRWRR